MYVVSLLFRVWNLGRYMCSRPTLNKSVHVQFDVNEHSSGYYRTKNICSQSQSFRWFCSRKWQLKRYDFYCKNKERVKTSCDKFAKNIQIQDVTVIIFDVGKNAAERILDNGRTFFEEARNCIEKIILKKVNMSLMLKINLY